MTLQVFTSQLSRPDVDGLDITRAGGLGFTFAPSEQLQRRRRANESDRDWLTFFDAYTEEMRESYKYERQAWVNLLALPRVVLECQCTDAARCHRTVLAQWILPKFDAIYCGELV